MLQNIVAISLGGALGAIFRYAAVGFTNRLYDHHFPLGTLLVNLIGSLLIGLLWGGLDKYELAHHYRLFVFVGILGGFTTFSSFALDNFHLFENGHLKLAAINIFVTNSLGILFVFAGMWISEVLWKVR